MNLIQLPKDGGRCYEHSKILGLNVGNFLTIWVNISFSRRTLLRADTITINLYIFSKLMYHSGSYEASSWIRQQPKSETVDKTDAGKPHITATPHGGGDVRLNGRIFIRFTWRQIRFSQAHGIKLWYMTTRSSDWSMCYIKTITNVSLESRLGLATGTRTLQYFFKIWASE